MTVHIPTHFSSSDKLLLSEYQNELKELGFVFNSKFSFIEVPKILADRDVIDIIEELIADLRKGLPLRHLDYLTHKLLTYLACRSAVKAGDKLHPKEMMTILQDLQNTANKYTCPHGRPTMIEVPLTNLHKLFKRI